MGLENIDGYGIIGGHDDKELEPEKKELNVDNEWHKAIQQYLKSGDLTRGKKAIPAAVRPQKPRIISSRQRAATRR